MLLLINEKHLNERYIIVGKTLSFSELTSKISKVLGVKAPSKFIKKWMLSLAWRLDWIKHKVLGKKRKLTKNICKTLNSKNYYSSEKFLKLEKGFDFRYFTKFARGISNDFYFCYEIGYQIDDQQLAFFEKKKTG